MEVREEKHILSHFRKLNDVLQESITGKYSFNELCAILSDLCDANVYLADDRGHIIGVNYKIKEDSAAEIDPSTGTEFFPREYTEAMLKIKETKANFSGDEALEIFSDDLDTQGKLHTLVPVQNGLNRLGTLILTRYNPSFDEVDLVLAEVGATVVGMEIQRIANIEKEEASRDIDAVNMALNSLSYSEAEAVFKIFDELGGAEGTLVASKIANESSITRSVIVNALRKLEGAGIIESRSLGMKGTRIRILNEKFYEQLEVRRK